MARLLTRPTPARQDASFRGKAAASEGPRGGTDRISCEPFVPAMGFGERENPFSSSEPR